MLQWTREQWQPKSTIKKTKIIQILAQNKSFFFCFCWDDNTLTAAHNDKCDEQNVHVEKVQRNNHEISRPFIKPMNTERVLWVHHPTIKSHRDTTI